MRFLSRRDSGHRELTAGAYVVTAAGYRRLRILAVAVPLAALLLGAGSLYLIERFAPGSPVAALEEENRALREAADKARIALEVELATRGELERQIATLKERLRQTEDELAFIKKAGGARGAAR